MYIIIGMGNPGEEYENTIHNLGRMAGIKIQKLDKLRDFNFNEKFNAWITEGKIGKEKVVVALPDTSMNKTGNAVGPLSKAYKLKPSNIIAIHDDSDIQLGKIKIVQGKSSAGHKGVESVIRALKTKDFIRIRIGSTKTISKKGIWRERDLMQVVIKKPPASQKRLFQKGVKLANDAAIMIVKEGVGKAMSIYNR